MSVWMSLRSSLGSGIFAVFYTVMTVFSGLVAPVVAMFFPGKHRQKVLNLHNWTLLKLLRILCGVKVNIQGKENLIKGRPVVLVSNHQSEWETYFLQVLVTPLSTVLKKELLSIPFFGWGLRMVQPIAIDRGQPTSALKQILKQGKERLLGGRSVLIFPEGTRVQPGEQKAFNKGAAMLATSAGVPILPMVHNGGHCWPGKKWRKYPGTIQVIIGPAIPSEGKKTGELHQEMEDWMRQHMEQIELGTDKTRPQEV